MLYTMLCCQYPVRARLVHAALHNLHAVKLCTQAQPLHKQGGLSAYTIGQTHCIDSPTRCLLCPQFDDPRDAKLSEKSAQMRFRQRALQGTSQHGSRFPHQIQCLHAQSNAPADFLQSAACIGAARLLMQHIAAI